MSEYYATVEWLRKEEDFLSRKYSRGHEWRFDGGVTVPASSSPHIVPLPMSEADNVDPEEAFVASLSSCHMLFFLDFASRAKLIVDSYTDEATGILSKDAEGRLAMTEVTLQPKIIFSGEQPDAGKIAELHHKAHNACFIANSVLTEVRIK
ncbi:OsmC family protein [Aliamphritea ceti]|uniref:OsmC family protein n=1 Tax=Aliamphritea ceti TaxID=1524258 RepID=UPI0021C430F6|nr:OsmC family protein [Aliamphritea ceti]